jgi:carbonic anhydrase/acetyltransferase-like protein (isoleucine patch superfamily)
MEMTRGKRAGGSVKLVIPIIAILLLAGGGFAATKFLKSGTAPTSPAIHANPPTDFAEAETPHLASSAYVHPQACVIGHVSLGESVFVAPFASIRGDEGVPIFVGDRSNVQDGVVIHGRPTREKGETVEANVVTVRHQDYSVYLGKEVSLEHQCVIHGPVWIEDGSLIGAQAQISDAHVGRRCVIGPRALVLGVEVRDGRSVPPGALVTRQETADALPRASAAERKRAEETVEACVTEAMAASAKSGSEKSPAAEKGEKKAKSH